jgi:hypothetical protein
VDESHFEGGIVQQIWCLVPDISENVVIQGEHYSQHVACLRFQCGVEFEESHEAEVNDENKMASGERLDGSLK